LRPQFTLTALAVLGIVAAAAPASAQIKQGDWLFRVRAIDVIPNESSGPVTGVPGSAVGVGNSVMPEIDFTYMATDNIGAELILATTKHSLTGEGSIAGVGQIGSSWVLPPTLTLQYHANPHGHVRPYVGAGINFTIFYSSKSTPALDTALGGASTVKLDDSFGYALQAGVDFDITPKVFANLDLKYIDMSTTAHVTTGAAVRTVDANINPLVVGVGVGFRF
jgi:outer membrane protein